MRLLAVYLEGDVLQTEVGHLPGRTAPLELEHDLQPRQAVAVPPEEFLTLVVDLQLMIFIETIHRSIFVLHLELVLVEVGPAARDPPLGGLVETEGVPLPALAVQSQVDPILHPHQELGQVPVLEVEMLRTRGILQH